MGNLNRILGLACILLISACGGAVDDSDSGELRTIEVPVDGKADASQSCQVRCGSCGPNQSCTQECTVVGQCASRCDYIMLCVEGYTFDDASCRCIREPGSGQP